MGTVETRGGMCFRRIRARAGWQKVQPRADDSVLAAIAALQQVAERNVAEVNRILRSYFLRRDELEPFSRSELQARMKKGLVTLLDVRPQDEFALRARRGKRSALKT